MSDIQAMEKGGRMVVGIYSECHHLELKQHSTAHQLYPGES